MRWPVFFSYFRCLSTCVCTGWGWQGLPTLSFGCRPSPNIQKATTTLQGKPFVLYQKGIFNLMMGTIIMFEANQGRMYCGQTRSIYVVRQPDTDILPCLSTRKIGQLLFQETKQFFIQIFLGPTFCIFQTYELEHYNQHCRLSVCEYWLSWTNTAEQTIPITILILKRGPCLQH